LGICRALKRSYPARVAVDLRVLVGDIGIVGDIEGIIRAAHSVKDRSPHGRFTALRNPAFFKRLIISHEGAVSAELAEPWDVILGEELRRAVASREAESLTDAIKQAERNKKQHPREPELALVGATAAAPDSGDGWSPNILVRARGLEPPRAFAHRLLSSAKVADLQVFWGVFGLFSSGCF
jgi:hypothetical protein